MQYRILLSTKDLVWLIRNKRIKKLIEKFIESYKIKKIILVNMVKLELLVLIKIYLIMNISRILMYQKQIKKISPYLIKINREKKYKVENILNRREVREKPKYFIR